MSETLSPVASNAISFGPFRLLPAQRLLEKEGVPTQLGGRALDILLALIECAGEVVGKQDLIARAWPEVNVEDGTLRFHLASVRRVLGDGVDGARYITNIAGRGYCFVAPVERGGGVTAPAASQVARQLPRSLPARVSRMVGRDESVRAIAGQLLARRFVTIVGPGGIGKTTVAVAVADTLLGDFSDEVQFVDFAPVRGAALVPGAVASGFGLVLQSDDAVPSVINFLRQQRTLIVFDNCEHVIDAVASLAEQIIHAAANVYILATSRESLRVEGEHVHTLHPLEGPSDACAVTAAEALRHPATQLFVERAAAASDGFVLNDGNAGTIAEICRRLDGIALAIELAAGRVNAYGVADIASLLDDRFRLLTQGRRTALSRHQTLRAVLDWSYDLLPSFEQTILRRLAVFAGIFTLESVREIAADDADAAAQTFDAVANLVAKSLVATEAGDRHMRYRLLDSTRAYAFGKLLESGEADRCARLHAHYYVRFLERADAPPSSGAPGHGLARHAAHIGNVRAALEWAFSTHGDRAIAIALAVAAAPLLLELSLLTECHEWTSKAVSELDESNIGSRREMALQTSLGIALIFTKGNIEAVQAALERGLSLADQLKDQEYQMRLLDVLYVFWMRLADFRQAFAIALRTDAAVRKGANRAGTANAEWMLGISHHFAGSTDDARACFERALAHIPVAKRANIQRFGVDRRTHVLGALARNLWLQGYPDQALSTGRRAVEEAETLDHPGSLCIALTWVTSVALWVGDLAMAQSLIARLLAQAERHSLGPYQALGIGWKGCLHVVIQDAPEGIRLITGALATLQVHHHELLNTILLGHLAEAFALTGDLAKAIGTIDQVIAGIETTGEMVYLPELLRIKGEIVAADAACDPDFAEQYFLRSLAFARTQPAPSWELRTATSLARFWHRQGRAEEGLALLASAYERFTEGFASADLRAARRVLEGAVLVDAARA
jgi:predicted ATPase/DNA-binding winged helix-turn-helix (wHTH) protein